MSNHRGSYLLNAVMLMLEKNQVFELLGKDRSQRLVLDIVDRADRGFDCNPGEILDDGVGERLGICYHCLKPAQEFEEGVCRSCFKEWG